jgi:hypothetical protein
MSSLNLPPGGNDFRISGVSGFRRALSSLVRRGSFSSLKSDQEDIIKIFKSATATIKRNGKIPYSTRRRALNDFAKKTSGRQKVRDLSKILDHYS